jgi:quercetin dioxygenase-like cupin family protein
VGIRTVAAQAGGSLDGVEAAVRGRFEDEGLQPQPWSSGPGHRFAAHSHALPKVLYCVRGGITFEAEGHRYELGPGDRLEIDPDTEHFATVGPEGVDCMEAFR